LYKMLEIQPAEMTSRKRLARLSCPRKEQSLTVIAVKFYQPAGYLSLYHLFVRFSNAKLHKFVRFSNIYDNIFVRFSNALKIST
ncbi:MAG: hypothetical protein ACI3X9_09870, partial [Bacteroidaceae bacterium]